MNITNKFVTLQCFIMIIITLLTFACAETNTGNETPQDNRPTITATFSYPGPSDNSGATLASIKGIESISAAPTWSDTITKNDGSQVMYSINKSDKSTPSSITINANTGIITISSTATSAETGTYTITASSTASLNVKGTQTTTIHIKVFDKPSALGSYIRLDAVTGTPLYKQTETYNVNGNALDGTKWGCVYDYQGLYWEIKTDDNGARDKDNKYQWGGITAIGLNDAGATKGTYNAAWDALVNAANAENSNRGLCGFTDWRVPERNELNNIVNDAATAAPTVNTNVFPNTGTGNNNNYAYWTSRPSTDDTSVAWVITYSNGWSGKLARTTTNHVRLVRGGQLTVTQIEAAFLLDYNPDDRYVNNGNGTITDTKTGLMWKRCAEGASGTTCGTGTATTYTHADALALNNSTFANFTDWRVPTRTELRTLTALHKITAVVNVNMFPNTPNVIWSATDDLTTNAFAWSVSFGAGQGHDSNQDKTAVTNNVRLVRDAP